MKPVLYLGGPIAGCTHQEMHEWRDIVKYTWGLNVYDPTDRIMKVGWGVEDAIELVAADKSEIDKSDVILIYPWKDSPGTSMEIIYAHISGCGTKKIVVIWDRDTKPSPWIQAHATHIVSGFCEARNLISNIAESYSHIY